MIYPAASLALLSFLAVGGAVAPGKTLHSQGHAVSVSGSDVHSKWAIFPEQHEFHAKAASSESVDVKEMDASKFVSSDSFWKDHGSVLDISPSTEMKLKDVQARRGQATSSITYDQVVDGVRVFGGEFRLKTGAHGGVVNAHGLPFRSGAQREYSPSTKASILSRPAGDASLREDLFRAVENHVYSSQGARMSAQRLGRDPSSSGDADAERPVELVWYSPQMAKGVVRDGSWALSYFMRGVRLSRTDANGAAGVNAAGVNARAFNLQHQKSSKTPESMICDVFVDAVTLRVVEFIDKSTRVYTSPFSNPLDRVVEVTDSPSQAIVFDANSTFPTMDFETDLLVTTTMYVSNLMNSISGGEYQTWAKADVKLNIESKLSIANAYFDGDWGIHFGTGYITDDVVGHEWGHGYMETSTQSLYQYQSGAMDEAFADILGEAVDILNEDTADTVPMRTSQVMPPCTMERGGTDTGNRWSMGEEVTGGGGGSLRDMYSPTCHYDPDTTHSSLYYCGSADSGGVHWNSGVVNRLFSVLVDGGVYGPVPGGAAGDTAIQPIGMTKALNLFWNAYITLTPTAQFYDLAIALKQECAAMVGGTLYAPNLLTTTVGVSAQTLSASDCNEVGNAVDLSGMPRTDLCTSDDLARHSCSASAPASDQVANEPYSRLPGEYYYTYFGCYNSIGASTYRVFDYATLGLASSSDALSFKLDCVEFAYMMFAGNAGDTTSFAIKIYVDSTGGDPDFASMTQVGGDIPGTVVYTEETALVTVVPTTPLVVTLPSTSASVVVELVLTSSTSSGYTIGRGQFNKDAIGTPQETFVSGTCTSYTMMRASVLNSYVDDSDLDVYQWYVQLTKSLPPVATEVPTAAPTVSAAPTTQAFFMPQTVEFGNLTSIVARRNKDEWLTDDAYPCTPGASDVKRFSVLNIQTVVQSPSSSVMNLVVSIQHRRQTVVLDKAFLNLQIKRRVNATSSATVYQREVGLFEESTLLTHHGAPYLEAAGDLKWAFKVGLQVDFSAAGISPLDSDYEARISIGVKDDPAMTDSADFRVHDCVFVKHVGVAGY